MDQSTLAVDLRSLDRTTFGDLLRRYVGDVTVAKRGSTVETYRLRQMLRHPMALLPLSRLSGATFAAYRDQRLHMVTGETVRRELTILRHVLEVARREWDVPFLTNPVSLVKRPPPSR
ncbi:MAG: site-specific integrase, partial [Janthinobacterium lividum]